MRWPWQKKGREPSQETLEARAETRQAEQKLNEVKRDDRQLDRLTKKMQNLANENNFAADIRRALGGAK